MKKLTNFRCNKDNVLSDEGRNTLVAELLAIRAQCGQMNLYDWMTIPVSYVQVCLLSNDY